jgi:sec-independent protein translocase protein TatC
MPRERRDEDLFQESTMTFGEHLEELRECLWRAIVGLVLGFIVGIFFAEDVVGWIQTPLENALEEYRTEQGKERIQGKINEFTKDGYPANIAEVAAKAKLLPKTYWLFPDELAKEAGLSTSKSESPAPLIPPDVAETPSGEAPADGEAESFASRLVEITLWQPVKEAEGVTATSLSMHEAFAVWIKAALLVGLILSSPWVFYQIWSFVAAGLYPHEKKYIHIFLPVSLGLFMAGAATVFLFVFAPVLKFLFMFNSMLKIDPDPRIEYWLSFVLILPLGFGISFQLPLVMLFLERIGIFTVKTYLASWRMAVLVIFVIAMFLTPADPTSMILMAAPLTVLYFGGILMCMFLPKNRSPYDDLEEEGT